MAADAVSSRTVLNTVNAGRPPLFEGIAQQAIQTGWNFAEFTGGDYNREATHAFDLLERSTTRLRCAYRIGLSPKTAVPGRTYSMRVEVAGQVLPHRYRIQLLTRSERIFRRFAAILWRPKIAHAFPLYTAIRPLGTHGRKWRVKIQVGMKLASLLDIPLTEGPRKRWEIASLFSQMDGSRIWEFAGRQSLSSADAGNGYLNALNERILEIKPGHYQLRAVVRDEGSEKYTATQIDLHLPKPGEEGVIGPLCTSVQPSLRLTLPGRHAGTASATNSVSPTLMPCGNASLTSGAPLLMETWFCTRGENAAAPIALRGYIERDGIPSYRRGSPRLKTSGSCLQIDHIINTHRLSPGRYTYHILVPGEGRSQIELGAKDFTLAAGKPRETPTAASDAVGSPP